jgi:hypothetical protein
LFIFYLFHLFLQSVSTLALVLKFYPYAKDNYYPTRTAHYCDIPTDKEFYFEYLPGLPEPRKRFASRYQPHLTTEEETRILQARSDILGKYTQPTVFKPPPLQIAVLQKIQVERGSNIIENIPFWRLPVTQVQR